MNFRYYGPPKTWLDKCLKTPIWDDPSRGNVANGLKHWFNLNGSFFTIFIDQCEGNWVGKSRSWGYLKFQGLLFKHWLLMTSILFLVETIQCKQFRCIYGKNKKTFSQIFCSFFKSRLTLLHFKKKITLIGYVFPNLPTSKGVVG